jgi:hypothetical protein
MLYLLCMTNITNISGLKVKVLVQKSGKTREKVVALVQDILIEDACTFSLAGLDKLTKGELPKTNPEKILEALAMVLCCQVSDFTESEAKTA